MESDECFATTITSPDQRVAKQFKKAQRHGNSKEYLAQFLIEEWSQQKYASLITTHTLFATSGQQCYMFKVEENKVVFTEIPELMYKMEEADQKLILSYTHTMRHIKFHNQM